MWTSYPGYIFLFSGSHSEQDDSVEDSEALEPSFTTQTSELENYTNFNDSQDLYEILGVQRNASSKEIRQAYLELSKQNYPKIQDGKSFNFKFISLSYRILYNEDKRKIYDTTNNVNHADNYESNNENIDYLDRFTPLENSLIMEGLGLGYTFCFYNDCTRSFENFMCQHNILICSLCEVTIAKEHLQFNLWKHLMERHQIYKTLTCDQLDQFKANININNLCLDAESNILQPDLLSPVIEDIIKLVEEWQATQQPIVKFYQWFDFILTPDTLKFLEAIVRGKIKFDILEYFMNKVARAKGSPEILIFNKFFHENRSIKLIQSVLEQMILRNIYQPEFRPSWRKSLIMEYKTTNFKKNNHMTFPTMNDDVLDVLTLNVSAIITFRFLSQMKNDLSLSNIIHLYYNIIPIGVRVNVNEARGRRVEGVFAGKSEIKELLPIFDKIRCKYCLSEFGTIYSLKKHEFLKHERTFKCDLYVRSQNAMNEECREIFQDRKTLDKNRLSIHHKL